MEVRYVAHIDDHTEQLAHHAIEAQLWDKAVTYCRRAGHKALARTASKEAIGFFGRALEIIRDGEIPNAERHTVDVLLELGNAHFPLGERDKAVVYIGEAKELAEGIGDH